MFKPTASPLVPVAVLLAVSAPLYFARGIGIFDDSLYLKIGQLVLDGFTPYRDFYDNKPPGLYYVSAAIAAVGGRGWLAPRIFLFLFAAAFQIALIRWLQRQYGASVATIAAVFIGLSYPLSQGYSLHTEPFGAAAAFAACAVLLTGVPSLGRWASAGALVGVATVFKQTGILYLAAFALFALLDLRRIGGMPAAARSIAALFGGFAAALTPVAAIFAAQGLGPELFDAVVTGMLNRGSGGLASSESIVVTWLFCPAVVAFFGIAALLSASRPARRAMDDNRARAFLLFSLVGVLAILPTLKTNLAGHYLQPGAFALSAACAVFLDGYRRSAAIRPARLVGAATVGLMAAYFAALSVGSAAMLRQNRLRTDLAIQQELRQTLDARLSSDQTVLCMSISSSARLYLMSGRRPYNKSLYFYPSVDHLFNLDDARRVLLDGRAVSALVEIHPEVDRPELTDAELATLRSTYEIIPIGPQTDHRLLALIRHLHHEPNRT